MCCLLKSIKSYWVSEILVKGTLICVYIQCSPVLLMSLIPKQIFQSNKFNKMSIFTYQFDQEMKEGGSKHREREVLCPGSDGHHVNAAWHDLPQVLLVSLRTGSLFYSPESNLTVLEEAPAPDLYLTYLSLNVECPF